MQKKRWLTSFMVNFNLTEYASNIGMSKPKMIGRKILFPSRKQKLIGQSVGFYQSNGFFIVNAAIKQLN